MLVAAYYRRCYEGSRLACYEKIGDGMGSSVGYDLESDDCFVLCGMF